jgi:hypothetical protein
VSLFLCWLPQFLLGALQDELWWQAHYKPVAGSNPCPWGARVAELELSCSEEAAVLEPQIRFLTLVDLTEVSPVADRSFAYHSMQKRDENSPRNRQWHPTFTPPRLILLEYQFQSIELALSL